MCDMKKETFDALWNNGISIKAERIVDENKGNVVFDRESKERIFKEYNKLRDYTKISFMQNPDGLLDRHKVCACLIYAIIKSKPLVYDNNENGVGMQYVFNESLAITIGLSLLYNYIVSSGSENAQWLKSGFVFPKTDENRQASYESLLCLMLFYDVKNKQYSILALANILFMIEEYTKLSAELKQSE